MGKILNEELLSKYAPDQVNITTFHTKVVGTTFRVPEEIALVEEGDFVLLDPEVGNPHDAFAVRVVHDRTGNHIGYVPKINSVGSELGKEVWENTVKLGHLYVGRVTITGKDKENRGFNLEVKHLQPKN